MRAVVLGKSDDRLALALAARFRGAGLEVLGPPDRFDDDGFLKALEGGVDVGIDACVVSPERKARAVALLDLALPATAPLLTCCHAASVAAIATGLEHPGRVVGFGFVPPWADRRTVECALGVVPADQVAAAADAAWRIAGLEPGWVRDSVGLVTGRILACLANEAAFAVGDGTADSTSIDRAMVLGMRLPRGPLAWAELIGLDHVVAMLDAMAAEMGAERYRVAPLLRQLVAAGRGTIFDPE